MGNIQELRNILINVYGIKCLKFRCGEDITHGSGLSLYSFYGYFRVFCSEPAGCGHRRGSRCFRFEWQVVIYADLCSQSEPPNKSIISYYSESHFCIEGFILQHLIELICINVINMTQILHLFPLIVT